MFGALIVEGDFDDVPEIAAAEERVLILNEVLFDYLGAIENYDTVWPEARAALPRRQRPARAGDPDAARRGAALADDRCRARGQFPHRRSRAMRSHVIAYDGIRRDRIDRRDDLVIAPGQRADILVKAGAPGTYLLAALPNDQGYPSPTGPLARLVVEGRAAGDGAAGRRDRRRAIRADRGRRRSPTAAGSG